MLCGIPSSELDHFDWGWGRTGDIFNTEGFFSWILTLNLFFEHFLMNSLKCIHTFECYQLV